MRIGCCGPFTAVGNVAFAASEFISMPSDSKRSHQPQRFHFFLQPGQLHLFLPQNFVNVLHRQGTCGQS